MKTSFYIIIILTAIAFSIYYFKPGLFQSFQNRVINEVSPIIPIESLNNKTTIYKWQNNNGELQISNTPPPKGVKFKTEEVQNSINVMPSKAITGKTTK